MTLQQIKYFVTVAKSLSFTKAAEQLFISQPALSRHIRNMEEELNIQLFVRTGSGIRLTPAGSVLLVGFSDIYDKYTRLVANADKVQKGLNGTLKIGILEGENTSDFMPKVYHYFQQKHPEVDLVFSTGSFRSLISDLYNGDLDMALTVKFEVENKESIIYQYVQHSKDYIVMNRQHPLAQKDQVTLHDIKEEKFVMISTEDNPESSPLIFDICKKHGFVPQVQYARSQAELILWIEVGVGVSILDTRSSIMQNKNIKCYEIESDWDPSLVVAWNQGNYNPLIEVFLRKLNEVLGLENEDIKGI